MRRQNDSFSALTAQSRTFHAPFGPWASDCMMFVIVRYGAATITTEPGMDLVRAGDCLILSPNVPFGGKPERLFKATTIYVDADYLADQVFWQYSNILNDRLDALTMAKTIYAGPMQILTLGPERARTMMPWLDDLTAYSDCGGCLEHFHRIQALWSLIMDVITPLISFSSMRSVSTQPARTNPIRSQDRVFVPARDEAVKVREMLRENPQKQWTLYKLAKTIHLSPKQLSRIFTATYGQTPLAYLTMIRVEEMARLLRQTNLPVGETGIQVGWNSRSRAYQAFGDCSGMTPQEYRKTHQGLVRPAKAGDFSRND